MKRTPIALGIVIGVAIMFATMAPAGAWDEQECADWYAETGEIHEDCTWWTPPTTAPSTTSTTVVTPSTTVAINPEPAPVDTDSGLTCGEVGYQTFVGDGYYDIDQDENKNGHGCERYPLRPVAQAPQPVVSVRVTYTG